jgi:SAM-dependent methyltransferase
MYQKLAYEFCWKAEKLITPGLRSSQYAYYERLSDLLHSESDWLDMGCGHQVFGSWMTKEQEEVIRKCRSVTGIDLDWSGLRAHAGIARKTFGDLTRLPFQKSSFDVVSANMVMEHVQHPDRLLDQVQIVLKPGGYFVFHTPNFWHWGTQVAWNMPDVLKKPVIRLLDGRKAEDVFETHYRMNRRTEIQDRARRANFDVVGLSLVSSSAALAMLGPFVLFELAFIRMIQHSACAGLRSNLIVVLRKPTN